MIIFTRPPYPWLLYSYLLLSVTDTSSARYLRRGVKGVIIDSGVHKVFKVWRLSEYPGGPAAWMARIASLYSVAKRYVDSVYAVVPDYPSDYRENPVPNNVERTIKNIELALDSFRGVRWIIPVQGRPDSVQSVAQTIELLEELGLLRSSYVAVAPTCTSKSVSFLKRLAEVARALLPRDRKIHMFGVTMRAWGAIEKYVDSTDTIVYSYMCKKLYGKLCSKTSEHVEAWRMFLEELRRRGYLSELPDSPIAREQGRLAADFSDSRRPAGRW